MAQKKSTKKPAAKKKIEIEKFQHEYRQKQTAKIWMWFGIIVVGLVLVVSYVLMVKFNLNAFSNFNHDEDDLVEKTQENWNQIFIEEKQALQEKNLQDQIKEAINKIIIEENLVPTNTSNTVQMVSTTTSTVMTTSTAPSTKLEVEN